MEKDVNHQQNSDHKKGGFSDIISPESTNNNSYTNDSEPNKVKKRKKTCQNAKWGSILLDYSQETSFHGPKQIFQPQPFMLRRFIWLLLFLGGMVIFLLQVAISIDYYLTWPVSVDVKINYNDSIVFPAVTICNGNAFRTTRAYNNGQFNLISELYGPKGALVDVEKYNATYIDLEHLYNTTGHDKNDLIVSCEWDGAACSLDDFVVTMADYGMCYTFNSGKTKAQPKLAYQTGAGGGLRLQLNIEQYEYMRGPNDGAGMKILIHNHNEVPLVRDHGLAVPPGSHGFVAIKTVEVNNLEPYHGKCNDSVQLDYFEEYTVSSCYTNCKERHLVDKCGCRDIYMPHHNGYPPVCSIETYQTCMLHALEEFSKVKHQCQCPVPCHRLMYETIVSYASTSNFDIDSLVRQNNTDALRDKYLTARETTERVNEAVVADNTALISSLNSTVERLDGAFKAMDHGLQDVFAKLTESYEVMQQRIKFQRDRGLVAVEFTVEHDFVRGWNVYKERSFHYVTLDFMGLPGTLKRTIENSREHINLNDTSMRQMVYLPVQDMLQGRSELIDRASEFINETNNAYITGDPLLTYRLTYKRRYDMSYISLPLLHVGEKKRPEQYSELVEALDRMKLGLDVLQEVGELFVTTGIFNISNFNYGEERFLSGGRQFNYRLFMFESRVVLKPLEEIQERLAHFDLVNRTLHEAQKNVERMIIQIKDLFHHLVTEAWPGILEISQMSSDYLVDQEILKTPLSMKVTSTGMEESIRNVAAFFADIRLKAQTLQNELELLKRSYKDMWSLMLLEDSPSGFYEMLYNDTQDFLSNETTYEFYIKIFAHLLRTSTTMLRNYTPEEIVERMNGNFHMMNISKVLQEIDFRFSDLNDALNLGKHIKDSDELFLEAFENYKKSLKLFLEENEINSKFYRENFMRLDVFMQELSYEEITQQIAYDVAQLLSDIGGSMGLFIGGSVLSVFEFLDIFIHHGARIVLNR